MIAYVHDNPRRALLRQLLPDVLRRGSLLILAPWGLETMGAVGNAPADSDYSQFHNLNTLAAEICAFDGEARILEK